MLVAVDPSLVVGAVVVHSSQVIAAAGTAKAVSVAVTADSSRAVKVVIETAVMADSSQIAELVVGASSVAGEVEVALAAGIVVVAVAIVAAVPSPVVVVEMA